MKKSTRKSFELELLKRVSIYKFNKVKNDGKNLVFIREGNLFNYRLYFDLSDRRNNGHIGTIGLYQTSNFIANIFINAGSPPSESLTYISGCGLPDYIHDANKDGYANFINNSSELYLHENNVIEVVEEFCVKYILSIKKFIENTEALEKLDILINLPTLNNQKYNKVSIYFAGQGVLEVLIGLIVAKLLKRDYYESLVITYERFLKEYLETDDLDSIEISQDFNKLVKYLHRTTI